MSTENRLRKRSNAQLQHISNIVYWNSFWYLIESMESTISSPLLSGFSRFRMLRRQSTISTYCTGYSIRFISFIIVVSLTPAHGASKFHPCHCQITYFIGNQQIDKIYPSPVPYPSGRANYFSIIACIAFACPPMWMVMGLHFSPVM